MKQKYVINKILVAEIVKQNRLYLKVDNGRDSTFNSNT